MPLRRPRVNQEVVTSLSGEFLSFLPCVMSADEEDVRPGRCAETRVTSCYKCMNPSPAESQPCIPAASGAQELAHHRSCPHFLTSSHCAAVTRSLPSCSSKLSRRSPALPSQIVAFRGEVLWSCHGWEDDCIYGTRTDEFRFAERA